MVRRGRNRPCHGEPSDRPSVSSHQATHLEADHLGLLVAYDQQRGKPAEEGMWPTRASDWCSSPLEATARPVHRVIRRKTRSSLDARLHADLSHKQLRSLLCAQLSAVQAAADPERQQPGLFQRHAARRSTGIREGSLGILCSVVA